MHKIKQSNSDRKYFTQVNRIVWAKCRSPFDYTLWATIKMIAGEEGECFLATPDLAALAMMSTGKVSECRKHLIRVGLLKGELRRDPGYPQPVWHLRIPDLWRESIEWAEKHRTLGDRIRFKATQKEPSPHEGGLSRDEGGLSPHETKKNHKEEPKEEREIVTQSLGEIEYIPIEEENQEEKIEKRNGFGPETDAVRWLFGAIGDQVKANNQRKGVKLRRAAKKFRTKAQYDAVIAAEKRLGMIEFKKALNYYFTDGCLAIGTICNRLKHWGVPRKKSIKSGDYVDYDERGKRVLVVGE